MPTESRTDSATDLDGQPILRASFNPLIRPYLVLYVAFVLCLTIVGIPFALLWVLGLGQWWSHHYFEKLECELSAEALRFRKGILFQVEKTIPLENIQDVTFIEGPLLRSFHLSVLKFETAGQSAGQAHDMRLIGIVDADAFRQQILRYREAARRGHGYARASAAHAADRSAQNRQSSSRQTEVLTAIDDKLATIIDLLKERR